MYNIIDDRLYHEIWDQMIVISPDKDLEYEEFLSGNEYVILTYHLKDLDSLNNKMGKSMKKIKSNWTLASKLIC